ncbi:MAG: cytochrome c family protein [Pseudomonadota bacterium]
MFDTMTLTKITGGFCGALLVFLLGAWLAEEVYHSGTAGYGQEQAYAIEVEGADEAVEEDAEPEVPFAEFLAVADPADGETLFNRACSACHKVVDGDNGVGPHLYGVVGRTAGSVDGFGYSGALSEVVDVWAPEELNAFLEGPRSYTPGTSMGYNGMRKVEDRAALVAWLDSLDD